MQIASFGCTDVGVKRDHNEDYMLVDPALGLFAVCDGMGGAEAGEVASEMAATTIRRVVAEKIGTISANGRDVAQDRMIALLRGAIEAACAAVYDTAAADMSKRGMGCTCTAVLTFGGKAVMGHVGDSRLYLCRGGAVTQLSEDHTFVAEAVKQGVFTPEEAAECGYKNVITRAIGKERGVMVDTLFFDVAFGDTLLLCSDGLHNYMKDPDELTRILGAVDPSGAPQHLISLANERGGSDNITAIVVRGIEAAASAETRRRSSDAVKTLGALQNIELMRDLTMAEVVRFKQIFQEAHFPAGDFVVREGEVNDTLYVIVTGSCEVVRAEQRIATLPAGAHFGEMSLLNSRPRSATVRAIEPCHMLAVDRDRLYGFLQTDGMLAAKLFWKLASTLAKRLDDLLAQQAEQKEQASQAQIAASASYYSNIANLYTQRPG